MSKGDRRQIVDQWRDERKPGRTAEPSSPKLLTPSGTASGLHRLDVSTGASPKPFRPRSPDERRVLIPPATVLTIPNLKIKRILIELKKLEVEGFENAVAVLLRVFLELSVEDFLDRKNIAFHENEKLRSKMDKVATHWESMKTPKREITAWRNAASSHALFSLNVLHGYVHGHQSIPKKRELLQTWDAMEKYFKKLWAQP